jgi:HK97 family phage major capsid protein
MTPQEWAAKRAALIAQQRAILKKTEDEKRTNLTAEEQQEYDRLDVEADACKQREDQVRKLDEQEAELRSSVGRKTQDEQPGIRNGDKKPESRGNPRATDEYRQAYSHWLATGIENRAMQADYDTVGGFITAPQQMVMDLIKGVDNLVVIRQLARKYSLPQAESIGVPTMTADVSDAAWTAELATGSADSALTFGKSIKVSNTLLRKAVIGPEALVNERFAYKFGVTEEAAFMSGTGAQQPLGVFTAHANGISTGRDISTGNTTTAITADNLFHVKYGLKTQYHEKGVWIFSRTAIKNIRLLKDGNGQYLWQPGLTGTPDTLLGNRVYSSEYCPSTFTTGLYVGIFGDFSWYWIVDALNMQMIRLNELYAATNETGFIARRELDGAPVLEEAFARVKLA